MKSLLTLLIPAVITGCQTGSEDLAPVFDDTEAYLDQEVLVSIADQGDGVARMEIEESYGLKTVSSIDDIGVVQLKITDETLRVKEVAALLEDDHRVNFAEPNYLVRGSASVNDTYVGYQWNLDQINAQGAWDYSTGAGAVVAVLDTGVSSGPDGIANLLSGYDFYNNDADPTDGNGHGTFVSGTINQSTNNNTGVAGIAYGASILPVKVLGDEGYGSVEAISSGIVYAANQGADVINMSLGMGSSSSTLEQAVNYAAGYNVVMVAATGNEFASYLNYPAAYSSVIAVGSSRADSSRPAYSNYGSGIDLLAPGGDLSRDDNGDGYADGVLQETFDRGSWTYTFWEGTSMATPHVAAAAAMLKSMGIDSPDDIYDILVGTATDVGASGYDTQHGYGVLNLEAALASAASGDQPNTPDTGSGGDDGTTGSGDDSSTDTTAPNISSVSGYTQGRRFTIQWVTNEPADTYLNFEDYGVYGDDALTTSHSITLTGSAGQTYYFDIESTDAAGNTAVDGSYYIRL